MRISFEEPCNNASASQSKPKTRSAPDAPKFQTASSTVERATRAKETREPQTQRGGPRLLRSRRGSKYPPSKKESKAPPGPAQTPTDFSNRPSSTLRCVDSPRRRPDLRSLVFAVTSCFRPAIRNPGPTTTTQNLAVYETLDDGPAGGWEGGGGWGGDFARTLVTWTPNVSAPPYTQRHQSSLFRDSARASLRAGWPLHHWDLMSSGQPGMAPTHGVTLR